MVNKVDNNKPFFVWHNFSRTHYRTNLSNKYKSPQNPDGNPISPYGLYATAIEEMDAHVGELLKLLDERGIAENTMVMFATDHGAASNSWPDGGNHPFKAEKGVGGYEGCFRVPMVANPPVTTPEPSSLLSFIMLGGFGLMLGTATRRIKK